MSPSPSANARLTQKLVFDEKSSWFKVYLLTSGLYMFSSKTQNVRIWLFYILISFIWMEIVFSLSRNSWEDVPKDTIWVSHRTDTGHAMMRILSAIPGPAAEVTPTASTGTTVKRQSKVEGGGKWFVVDYLLDALKYYSSQQGRTQWPRESLWYPGLASSLPVSASVAFAGVSHRSTEWEHHQRKVRLRQKFGSKAFVRSHLGF